MELHTHCLIIGSGPAGFTAAIYAARAGMKPVLYQGALPGGQLTITTEIENFPGYPQGVQGLKMMADLHVQAERFGADIRKGEITKVDFSQHPFPCIAEDGQIIIAQTVIVATGASARWLGLESENRFSGYGVSACATCDGFFFREKTVAVVGGGDTAAEEACYLSQLCKKVYLIHRRDALRASKVMQDRVLQMKNVEVVWNSVPIEILGTEDQFDKSVTGVRLQNTVDQSLWEIDLDGVFIAVGHHPNTDVFEGQLDLDEQKYIITSPGTSYTNIPGVFAAGDVADKTYRQAVTAAAAGCKAAIDAERWLLSVHD
jgi:thioredoxin reductase (NADPH)